ncbi:MAG: hypothetical protein LBL86_11105 [Coriobacteriales bacterium]|jgi:hypothetical protein|nr:hypothetical protein [Coriobacteriales bacterium]
MPSEQAAAEIGGYPSFEASGHHPLNPRALMLNTARNAIEYVIRARGYTRLLLPRWCCAALLTPASRLGVPVDWYAVDSSLMPQLPAAVPRGTVALVTNYFGLLSPEDVQRIAREAQEEHEGLSVLIDNSQAYFEPPLPGLDTVYSCRKFFGVPDGALLFSDAVLADELESDESFNRFAYLFKRLDCGAQAGYADFQANESLLDDVPLRYMSRSTRQVLQSLNREQARLAREANWRILHEALKGRNRLSFERMPPGPLCYPFLTSEGPRLRERLIVQGVFVPTYWADALKRLGETDIEYDFVENIVALPLDQRYGAADMERIVDLIERR